MTTGAERVDGRGGDDGSVDPASADMGSDHGDQVRADMDGDQAARRLSARQRAIVAACDVPRSLAELMERAGVSHRSHFRRNLHGPSGHPMVGKPKLEPGDRGRKRFWCVLRARRGT